MNKLFLISVVLLGLFLSCNRRVPQVLALHDSLQTTVRTEYITKEVQLPADSAVFRALLECDSTGQVLMRTVESLQGDRVRIFTRLENNVFTAKSLDKATKTVEYITRDSIVYQSKEVPAPYPVEVNKLTRMQTGQLWIARIGMALLLIALITKIKKSIL